MTLIIFIALAIIIIASTEYYKQIRRAQKQYEKSKNTIENIVLSFNRELKREANRLELVAYKVDGSLSKSENSIKRIDNLEKTMSPILNNFNKSIKNKTNIISRTSKIENQIQSIDELNQSLKSRIERLEEKTTKLTEVEEKITKLTKMPEIRRETVIPIRREKAMSAITETEIKILELLSSEGGKTAPEIKNRINLSREHTSRLMKKLYEKGYLERETGKLPFIYKIKEEMENILNNKSSS